jgi:Ca-activated chloride channel family protein
MSVMSFLWPDLLWLLTAVPALIAAYLFLLRRKKKTALRYASLRLMKEVLGVGGRFRRHLPPLLFLLAMTLLILAVARLFAPFPISNPRFCLRFQFVPSAAMITLSGVVVVCPMGNSEK